MYSKMAELLEDRENGDWKLEKFVIDNDNFMARIQGIMPGTYVRLLCKGECVMSDTDMEKRTNADFRLNAHGDVLYHARIGRSLI